MARTITIEGSSSPSVELSRGERRTVQLTDDVQALLDGGFVIEVDRKTDEPVTPTPLPETTEPSRSASREDWAEFLAKHPSAGIVTEGKDRKALLAEWDAFVAAQQ